MSKYNSFEGTVAKTARNGRAFEIDGEWYSVFKVSQIATPKNVLNPGDYVKFEYETVQKGGQSFHNIKGDVEVTAGKPARGGGSSRASEPEGQEVRGPTARDVMMVRQNALRHATGIVTALGVTNVEEAAEDAIAVARVLEAYIFETEE